MNTRALKVMIANEMDVVAARKRARRLAQLLGFDNQDQVGIATAVSEIVRNAFDYGGGGYAEFRVIGTRAPQSLEITVSDKGPGIADLEGIRSGARISPTGMGVGLTGSQRLMDKFDIETKPGAGTTIRMSKRLPARAPFVSAEVMKRVTDTLATDAPANAMEEIQAQNRLILSQIDELRDRHEELRLLNQELEDTNRGVVALYAELDERADHLRRADDLKSQFLSHMSHEFRTPLNSILALSSLLLRRTDGDLTEEQEKQVRFIRRAAENLTELVDDLLDLAKVEAGKIVISPSNFTAESLFGALRGMLRPLLPGTDVALIFDDASPVPELRTDEAKVSQILRNFISNALKFTERGEVRVSAVYDRLTDRVTFSVSDTGIGISQENIGLIFQEFAQVPNSLQRKVKGTGLGLPLAKKLAELLGGPISVESAPGQGSTFSVTIPRVFERAEQAAWELADWTIEEAKLPILVVEDNPVDVMVVRRMLAGSRYQMLHAGSTAAARAGLERLRPAAILLDIVLPETESWGLMLELRRSDKYADVPIMVLSATGEARKALHFGADEYLEKPVRKDVLLSLLDRLTGRSVVDVLIIDDEEVSRYLVRQLLPRTHYALREARDAHEGLRQMRMTAPDVVLLDLNLPGMSGYELLERFRADEAFRDIPAIVVTSAVLETEVRRRLSGAAAILAKSDLSADLLADAIDGVRGSAGEVLARGAMSGLLPGKLLVVDDDDAGRYVKVHLLRRQGYIVAEAANGQTALTHCQADVPDLVVLDTKLPDMDGTEICRRVKASLPRVAVLQTSALVGDAHRRADALESGADAFLVEPIEPVELIATVNALMRMHRAEQDLLRLNEQLEDAVARRTKAVGEANRRLAVESAERRKAEEVLWHAQKLEAVGQLTGGIAHDFNNLLAIIIGSLAMLRAHVEGKRHYRQDKLSRLLSAAETAADRGAKTTKQMLAFARRSVLSSKVVVLDEVLAAGESFLRRAVGETITLELVSTIDAWACRVDPTQFDAAILNLAVNARDAMPNGGSLTISTANVTIDEAASLLPDMPAAGAYVCVEVRDTGRGMDAETVRRAFEPFFTTKDVGRGTGLGLSQVYGFVTQSGGYVSLLSEIDAGSTFRIYLHRVHQDPVQVTAEDDAIGEVPTGSETILVVEDNQAVLELAIMTISDLGYQVLSAANGAEALKIMRGDVSVDLLFSDVVMPGGMNGFELVRRAREMRRGLKALVTSGYADTTSDDDEGSPLPVLTKPYARADLARRLREVLDVQSGFPS